MRYWTVDEARAFLPRLRMLVGVIRRATHLATAARGNGHASLPGPAPAGGGSSGEEAGEAPVAGLDAHQALQELEGQGIVLRDPGRGLIDFPAKHSSGQEVLLCWQLGEDDLEWWHLREDGFAGRRRLPLPPEL